METLRRYLGGHHPHFPNWLHVLEVGALIVRAGRAAGLIVKAEIVVTATDDLGAPQRGEMDCGWYSQSGDLIVAWEFDGRDVDDWHLFGGRRPTKRGDVFKLGNVRKFAACGAPIKVQVLYSLKNDLTPKPPARRSLDSAIFPDVSVVTDENLMLAGGIESLIQRARQQAGLA